MKKKLANRIELLIIFLVLGCIIGPIGIYLAFFNNLDRPFNFLDYIFASLLISFGIMSVLISSICLIFGYEPKERDDIYDDGIIKVLSLFKTKTEGGVPSYIYEIEFEDGTIDLLKDNRADLQSGIKYKMKRTEEWEKFS